ncbi:MAG: hypothetical protein A3C84_01510 [Candidatus Ryanbacteria bacterium RIFCSPHIGHO2_02_FULL_48_12]|uniref:UDP-N-acetylmuramoyl-L-alanyl-D-glutamate--2, 6-diaminopimelate ligase n=1 Tax=Candidatus Ryanbacteria bacterium RIFCSPHIGHO2_01_FULL_48_27 TaxID=1802115 RepID=A0A1G2G7F0_9BACT|nr:MAG: hypothetical protein A2756_06235 [Candidatus Ryanbacteria bacterium RIFCSPHIGHO2_01_FULL_48_27]OGZ49163.1 MAG: hypothetical protein A3C84_01510 [Candidatus Ryanbacteria bacterium RIFCSPHIGHO2_02_FULL_48_12]
MIQFIKKLIPQRLFRVLQPQYHHVLAWLGAVRYGFPARKLTVIGVTGTNGKSTTVELLSRILEDAGYKTASSSSVRLCINGEVERNELKMTMPGRAYLQRFLRRAVRLGCTHAVVEVTSEGIKQSRHLYLNFHLAVLTNITPEHIESHGSFEAYRAAKAELFKITPIHVLNEDDKNFAYFSRIPARQIIAYRASNFPEHIKLKLPGAFNRENAMAALTAARALGIDDAVSKHALESTPGVPGRMEIIKETPFYVVVDYAHTPDAFEKVFDALRKSDFRESGSRTSGDGGLICVFGCTGGGRDVWKRSEMGKVAAKNCRFVVLTNDDPYDESPEHILNDIESGILEVSSHSRYEKIIDRRQAIRCAISEAHSGDTIIITGKGSESVMVLSGDKKIPWDDRDVAREELQKLGA